MDGQGNGRPVVGIIGGSGLYDMDAIANKQWRRVSTLSATPPTSFFAARSAPRAWSSCRAMAAVIRDLRPI